MGIFSRLNRVIKSNLNALIDQAEDPDMMIGQTVTDMKSALKRARKDLIEALGGIDVFFPMHAHHDVLLGFDVESVQHVRVVQKLAVVG